MTAWVRQPKRQVWTRNPNDSLAASLVAAWECSDSLTDHGDPEFPNLLNPTNRAQDLIRTSGGTPAAPGAPSPAAYGLQYLDRAFDEGPVEHGLWGLYNTNASIGPRGQAVSGELALDLPDPARYTIELGLVQGEVTHAAVRNVINFVHNGEAATAITIRDAGGWSAGYTPMTMLSGSGMIYSNGSSLAPIFITRDGASVVVWDFRAPARVLTRTTTIPTARLVMPNLVALWEGLIAYVRIYDRPIVSSEAERLVHKPWSIWAPERSLRRPAAASPPSAIAGTAAGTSTAVGTLGGLGDIAGTGAGVGSATGAVLGLAPVAGSSAGAGTTAGSVAGLGAVAGTVVGTSTGAGVISGQGAVSALSAGAGVASGAVAGLGVISGSSAGVGAAAASVGGRGALSGVVAGLSAAAGLVIGLGAVSGAIPGSSTTAGAAVGWGRISGGAAGTSSVTGAVADAAAGGGLAAGSSSASGTVSGLGAVTGASSGSGAITGAITGAASLAGSTAASSAATGLVTGLGAVVGAGAGTSTVSGAVASAGLTGATAGTSGATGTLQGLGAVAGTSAGTGVATLALTPPVTLPTIARILDFLDQVPVLHVQDTLPVVHVSEDS